MASSEVSEVFTSFEDERTLNQINDEEDHDVSLSPELGRILKLNGDFSMKHSAN